MRNLLKTKALLTIVAVLGVAYILHGTFQPLNEDKVARLMYKRGQYGYLTYEAFHKNGIIVEAIESEQPSVLTFRRTFNVYISNMDPKWEAYKALKLYHMKVNRFGGVKHIGKMTVGAYGYAQHGRLILKDLDTP